MRKFSPWKVGVQWPIPNELLRIIVEPSCVYRKKEAWFGNGVTGGQGTDGENMAG